MAAILQTAYSPGMRETFYDPRKISRTGNPGSIDSAAIVEPINLQHHTDMTNGVQYWPRR